MPSTFEHGDLLQGELPRAVFAPLGFLIKLSSEGQAMTPHNDLLQFTSFQYKVKFTELFLGGPGGAVWACRSFGAFVPVHNRVPGFVQWGVVPSVQKTVKDIGQCAVAH